MHIAEVVTIAKSLPLLRLNTYKSLILSYSADYRRILMKNQDSTNNYDKTRMKLNFEIDSDGKLHLLGYSEKSLEIRLQERLSELG